MHDLVSAKWAVKLNQLRAEMASLPELERDHLRSQIEFMEGTDMAVVVSQAQNEQADLAEQGLDITPHRTRMVHEDLESKFKDPDDPFRLVFVCAMWLTGFDAPSCSTVYWISRCATTPSCRRSLERTGVPEQGQRPDR